jgi:hypothetical protein
MEQYRQFVLEGVQYQPEIWSSSKGQIYLEDEVFVAEMQKRIGGGRRFKYTLAAKAIRQAVRRWSLRCQHAEVSRAREMLVRIRR